jgi:gamma-glutamylcyclotransferase (GGCT)/AIG2-like uncharacterized protein YtfP
MTTQDSAYFAYGSNMDAGQMAQRCPGATPRGRGVLDGYRFLINSRGVATVEVSPGARVYGVLWSVEDSHLRRLDRYEGVRRGLYSRTRVPVQCDEGSVTSWVYIASDGTAGRPRAGYLESILAAARAAALPAEYIRSLQGAA